MPRIWRAWIFCRISAMIEFGFIAFGGSQILQGRLRLRTHVRRVVLSLILLLVGLALFTPRRSSPGLSSLPGDLPAKVGALASGSSEPSGEPWAPSGGGSVALLAPPGVSSPTASSPSADASSGAARASLVPCEAGAAELIGPVPEHTPPWTRFSYAGYIGRRLHLERQVQGSTRHHCVDVLWPAGYEGHDTHGVAVHQRIRASWFRLVENTLARLPWAHVELLDRLVLDDRPTGHGVAPFDRKMPDDARDGHTIWLHERLFLESNHWAHGNFGTYWAYHTQRDGLVVDRLGAHHDQFSPVLLHELGHLVAYHLVPSEGADDAVPPCAWVCEQRERLDPKSCGKLSPAEREASCISAYCMPFTLAIGSENWAEQYRFYFQSSKTRSLLKELPGSCFALLEQTPALHDDEGPPWEHLEDPEGFHRSEWTSCGGRACKPW